MAEIYMTNWEIVTSYLQAADPDNQITILSQLNACKRKTIIAILVEEGVYQYSGDLNSEVKGGGRHRKMEEKDFEFKPYYDRGLNDSEIARECGVSTTTILRWRTQRNLPPNQEPGWNGKRRIPVAG